jgi:hypothetical protein
MGLEAVFIVSWLTHQQVAYVLPNQAHNWHLTKGRSILKEI